MPGTRLRSYIRPVDEALMAPGLDVKCARGVLFEKMALDSRRNDQVFLTPVCPVVSLITFAILQVGGNVVNAVGKGYRGPTPPSRSG